MSEKKTKEEDLRTVYGSIVEYHNNLIQLRFTVAGLVFVANGFIVSEFLQPGKTPLFAPIIPGLGLIISFIFWLLDIRTNQLLDNIGARGLFIEDQLSLNKSEGFFSLMKDQPLMPKIPFAKEKKFPDKCFYKCLFSHSHLLSFIYIIFIIFWTITLFLFIQSCS